MSIPDNFEEFFKPQDVRRSALQSQLLALEGQVRVIKTLDIEHTLGIEGRSQSEFLLNHCRDLVKSAETVARQAKSADKQRTLEALRVLRETAIQIISRAHNLDKDGLARARMRLDRCVAEHDGISPESVEGRVPENTEQLAVKAGVSCYEAESEQFKTFALQVEALCDLTLEFAYKAALESPAFRSSTNVSE